MMRGRGSSTVRPWGAGPLATTAWHPENSKEEASHSQASCDRLAEDRCYTCNLLLLLFVPYGGWLVLDTRRCLGPVAGSWCWA